jgi:hypothetical protein
MPGFAGIVGPRFQNPASASEVGVMARALAGAIDEPSVTENFSSDRERAGVACVRRNSDSALAAWNERRDILLVFHGRDFDLPEKAAALRARGHTVTTDLECLVRCYEEAGEAFIAQLNGRFSGAIVDQRAAKVLLFNDRFGASRVYLHTAADGLCFATEAKALLAACPALRRVDPRGLGEFFSVGCVLQDRTLFPDITLLPPGALWTVHADGRIDKRRYFSPEAWEQQAPLAPEEFCAQLTGLFARLVPRYHREAGQVAMSMTGGLDSRMILAWAKGAPGALPCYTFGGPYRDCADVRLARRLAALAGQPHHTIPIGRDFLADFPALAERTVHLSDGAMDVSGAEFDGAGDIHRAKKSPPSASPATTAPKSCVPTSPSGRARSTAGFSRRSSCRISTLRRRLTARRPRGTRCRSSRSNKCRGTTTPASPSRPPPSSRARLSSTTPSSRSPTARRLSSHAARRRRCARRRRAVPRSLSPRIAPCGSATGRVGRTAGRSSPRRPNTPSTTACRRGW